MRQALLTAVVAEVLAGPAPAFDIPPPATPAQMAVISQVVVVGKVTSVLKDLVEAPL